MLGAGGDGAAEVGRRIHPNYIAIDADVVLPARKMENDPGKFAIADEQVGAATKKTKWNFRIPQQANEFRQRIVSANCEQIGAATDAERGAFGE